jgi:sulfur-oxidizing protein SoxB
MSMNRREFMQVLAVAAAAGMPISAREALAQQPGAAAKMYELPRFGNVHLLHFTDCHAQLLPIYFREPSVNIGVGEAEGKPPHLVGEHLLRHFGIAPRTIEAHAFTFLDFEAAARTYGKVYNAQAYKACSNMPRFGHNGILTEQQIKDLVALLMDPASPVNK